MMVSLSCFLKNRSMIYTLCLLQYRAGFDWFESCIYLLLSACHLPILHLGSRAESANVFNCIVSALLSLLGHVSSHHDPFNHTFQHPIRAC
jgi:hypothetical protein